MTPVTEVDMEKMLSETRLKRTHFVRAFLLVAVAASAFWLGLNSASASCGYDYNAVTLRTHGS